MKSLLLTALLLSAAGTALAGPTCTGPKAQWKPEDAFKKELQARGYQIRNFKVTQGNCYEMYGIDKAGKKVEIYFDPVSGQALETK